MLIPTSPGCELDPNLQGTQGLLSLTIPSAGWQLPHMGSMPGLPPFPAITPPSTPLQLKWELLGVTILLGGVINADLSLLSTPVLCVPPSRPRRVLRRPSWKLDGSVCHQPADSCLLLYLSTSPLPELRINKQG